VTLLKIPFRSYLIGPSVSHASLKLKGYILSGNVLNFEILMNRRTQFI
jgi:hypothetical protein